MSQEPTIGPTRSDIRKAIIASVIAKHSIEEAELLGDWRAQELVAARVDAARRLMAAGFTTSQIARALKRDRATVHHYLNDRARQNGRDYNRIKQQLLIIPADVRAVVDELAAKENVAPWLILKEWIVERAQYEIEARSRDARTAHHVYSRPLHIREVAR